jgi:hypothetical protein
MAAQVEGGLSGHGLGFLFIDGEQSYVGAKRNFEMYGPMVRKRGRIAFHDIVEGPPEKIGGVPRFWREIKSKYRHIEIINDRQQGGYGIGVLYVD